MRLVAVLLIFTLQYIAIDCETSSNRESRQFFAFRGPDDSQRIRPCTTPTGVAGLCQDVTNCPLLLLDLGTLVRSICFQSLFRPGTCCPIKKTTSATTPTTTTSTTSTTPSTTSSTTTTSTTTTTTTTTTTKPPTTTTTPPTTPQPGPTIDSHMKPPPLPSFTTRRPTTPWPSLSTTKWPFRPTTTRPTTTRRPRPPHKYECGVQRVTSARIVNGTESHPGQWPWMAALYLHGFLGSEFHCGGTILSKKYIVTAAHCMVDKRGNRFSPSQFSVRLGDQDISSKNTIADKYVQTLKVKNIRIHSNFKNYNHQYFENDIALLKLTKSIDFSPFVIPACLPSKAMTRAHIDNLSGEMATVIGYGRTSYSGPQSKKLLLAEMPIWWNDACDEAYFPPILETNICAGYIEGGIDSCQGDSGGPLLIYRNRKWVLLGIVSFGQKCAEPGYPGVYTRIPKFVDWIRKAARR